MPDAGPRPDVGRALPAAAVSHVALGLGFGIGAIIALDHRRRTGELPMTPFGFRAFAGGPFDGLDPATFSALLWLLVGVCAADVVAGLWLWRGLRRGAVLALGTSVPALGLAAGFALPFLLAGVPLRLAFLAAGRRNLRA